MIILLSPAKRLNFLEPNIARKYSLPTFMEESKQLIANLKILSAKDLQKLMNINEKLAEANYERFQNWSPDFNEKVAKPALLAFRGDVFLGMDPQSYDNRDFDFAQEHIRILSGLHGVLKPLDLIRPYRLEMGTEIKIGKYSNLYEFWDEKITNSIVKSDAYKKDNCIINLASKEYSGVLKMELFNGRFIEPSFKEFKNGSYRPIHILMKRARGMMTSYIVKNKITDPEQMKLFDWDGYEYNENQTKNNHWVFTRG